jgi:hypothetical protein
VNHTTLARSLTILNEMGDTTITWESEQDDAMQEIIERKMAAGVAFYIVPKRKPGQRGALGKPKKLTDPAKAREHRALSIPDADFSKFVLEGKGEAIQAPAPEKIGGARRAKTAKEVASGHSVGVQPRRGG